MADLSEHFMYHRSQVCDDDLYGWLLELIQGPEWHKQAACKGMNPEMFFPERGFTTTDGKRVCILCPVREECAAAGLDEHFGIWGATTERQRRRLRRQRNLREGRVTTGPNGIPAKCGTDSGYYRHRRLDEEPCNSCKAAHSMSERSRSGRGVKQLRFAERKEEGACPGCSRYEHDKCKNPCQCTRCHPTEGVA